MIYIKNKRKNNLLLFEKEKSKKTNKCLYLKKGKHNLTKSILTHDRGKLRQLGRTLIAFTTCEFLLYAILRVLFSCQAEHHSRTLC